MRRAVIYLRVSTEEQAEKGFSLQAQKQECLKKAEELNCNEIFEFCDEGVSGSLLERPMLINSLEALKQNAADYFICFDPSRLSRNVSHQLILIDTIKKNGARLIFVQSNYEDTAEGRFQLTIMAAVDEYERARLKIRTELGKRTKANQKLLTHNPNIYGYKFDKESDTLLVHEEQARIVRQIYEWLLCEGIGPSKIADRLNDLCVPSMRGKEWSRVSTNRILNNFSYTGILYIRRFDTKDYRLNKYKKKNEKARIVERPQEQWIGIDIPSIIDLETWQKAKKVLDKSKRIYKNNSKHAYLLTGLLRCGICGGTMYGKTSSGKTYYCCSNKYNYQLEASQRCKSRLLHAEELEGEIWGRIKPYLLNHKEIEKVLNILLYYKEEFQNKNLNNEVELVQQLNTERKKVIMLFQKSYIDEEELEKKLTTIDNRLKNHSTMLKTKLPNINIDLDRIIPLIDAYINDITAQQKSKILCRLINEIKVCNDQLIVNINIPISILEEK